MRKTKLNLTQCTSFVRPFVFFKHSSINTFWNFLNAQWQVARVMFVVARL